MSVKVEVTIYVPTADNKKVRFSRSHHRAFEDKLTGLFEGHTREPETCTGEWNDLSRGVIHQDQMSRYIVSVDGMLGASKALRAIVAYVKKHYSQKLVYCRYFGIAELL